MASHIRELLASAQAAEIRGDKPKAIALLKEAAAFYRDRKNPGRALQMLRHARRLEGKDPDEFEGPSMVLEFGEVSVGVLGRGGERVEGSLGLLERIADVREDVSIGVTAEPPEVAQGAPLVEREPTLADPKDELWCSFCCRPQSEAGRLVAAPTGTFICTSCVQKSLALLLKG